MAMQFSKGDFNIKNPSKYVGNNIPKYRSSWEFSVMKMCDENPNILQWASESVKFNYRDPLTNSQSLYVPDFFVVYVDKDQKKHTEIWEIKPTNQTTLENVGKNPYNQAQYVKNMAKWQVAREFCKHNNITFRIITEKELYHLGVKSSKKRKAK